MDVAATGYSVDVAATGYMVIGRLSALTHQVLGQFKMACLFLGSYVVLGADRRRHEGLVVESVRREAI